MKKSIWYIIILFVAITACSEDENYFGENSQERINTTLGEYNDVLLSSEHGWKMQYYPAPERLGGYNFLLKFEENNRVIMMSDFDDAEKESSYKFYAGQGAVLSFDTYSLLHVIADPAYSPQGTGYQGDYELIVERISQDSMVCKGRKWGQPMILTRASADDWRSGMSEIKNNEMTLAPVKENVPFFRNVRVSDVGIATFLYEHTNRFVEYYYNDENGDTKSGEVGLVFSREGFSLEHEININGTRLKDFQLDESGQGFTFGNNGTITMEDYSAVEFKDAWDSFYKQNGGGLLRTSKDLYSLLEEARALEPDFVTLQLYWNIQNLRLFSFVFHNEKNLTTRWFHSIIGNIDSPGEDNVSFEQRIDPATNLPIVIGGTEDDADELNRLFYEDNESSRIFGKLLDIFYDPSGFTVIPTSNNTYYLISKSHSNYWLLFTAYK